jgi:hypothetical protein
MTTEASEITPRIDARSGFGEIGERLRREPCSIAYLGASVTVQREGYRPRLHELLEDRFAQQHRAVFAGLGAVGAVGAVFVVDKLVLSREPDLCLIEYATGDYGSDRTIEEVEAALEGIVIKLRRAGIQPCFLHLYRADWTERANQILAATERVAERHCVPSVDLATVLRDLVSAGTLDDTALFRDGIHTTPEGSQLVAELAALGVVSIAESGQTEAGQQTIPAPSGEDFSGAEFVPARAEDAGGAGRMGLFRFQQPYLEITQDAVIRRRFDGELVGLMVLHGPESGELRLTDDADGSQHAMIWDNTCFYERLGAKLLKRRVAAGADMTIELTDKPPDYSLCSRPVQAPERRVLRVAGYMVLPA